VGVNVAENNQFRCGANLAEAGIGNVGQVNGTGKRTGFEIVEERDLLHLARPAGSAKEKRAGLACPHPPTAQAVDQLGPESAANAQR